MSARDVSLIRVIGKQYWKTIDLGKFLRISMFVFCQLMHRASVKPTISAINYYTCRLMSKVMFQENKCYFLFLFRKLVSDSGTLISS